MNTRLQANSALQFATDSVRGAVRPARSAARPAFDLCGHVRRIAIVVLSAAGRSWLPFILLGLVNRVFPILKSVFFCYAGNAKYASHYSYPSCRGFLLWFPTIIGIFRQGKSWGLICAAPVTEAEFTNSENAKNFLLLLSRLERIKSLLGAEQLSFAGILPSVIQRKWPESITGDLCDRTSEVVRKAVLEVRQQHFDRQHHNVVLLGGAGRIGRAVHEALKADGVDAIVIDSAVANGATFKDLGTASMLLVDVSRHGAIQRHIHELPEGTVVLNEVFPEPSRDVVREFKNKNISVYHIAGVKAEVYPSLPLGYKNAVPCCAIHSGELGEPVLTRLA